MTPPCLETERLHVALMQPGMENALISFHRDNREHFAPWDPPQPENSLDQDHWRGNTTRAQLEFDSGIGVRFVVSTREVPSHIIGTVNFSQISRGPFQAAFLGYKLARDSEGRGLMRETLTACLRYMFDEWRLHRIHANYAPENLRSGRLLARLGFTIEGYARDYLFINGAWRDHVLTSLTNARYEPDWLVPGGRAIPAASLG